MLLYLLWLLKCALLQGGNDSAVDDSENIFYLNIEFRGNSMKNTHSSDNII